jgi:hypothetical protein
MKTTVIAFLLGALAVGGITYKLGYFTNSIEYNNVASERVIDNTPDWAEDEDAVKAAQDVLRRKELEAELSQLESEVAERESRITEIEKELGTY